MKNLDSRTIKRLSERVKVVSLSLNGLGCVCNHFSFGKHKFKNKEFEGMAQILRSLSEEVSIIEDILNSGEDSMNKRRYGLHYSDPK